MRAGPFARVFTLVLHTLGLQLGAIMIKATIRYRELAKQVKDVGSWAQARPGRESLIKAVRHREVAVVLVGRLERSGR
jgi:hypothetical protein